MADKVPPSLQFTDDDKVTPAEEELKRAERAAKVRKMKPAARRKAKRDAARGKMAYDMPKDVIQAIRDIAGEEDVSQSNLVAYILADWVNAYDAGEVEIDQSEKESARHPRWLWKLAISELDARD